MKNRPDLICNDHCPDFCYIGDGDAICDKDPSKIVLSDWVPTEDFCWCKQKAAPKRER